MPTLKKHTETQLVNACLAWLKCMGIFAWRQNTGAMQATYKSKRRFVRFGKPGMSDIAGILPGGRALYVECKLPGRKLTVDQMAFLKLVDETGGLGIVVESIDELLCYEGTHWSKTGNEEALCRVTLRERLER